MEVTLEALNSVAAIKEQREKSETSRIAAFVPLTYIDVLIAFESFVTLSTSLSCNALSEVM